MNNRTKYQIFIRERRDNWTKSIDTNSNTTEFLIPDLKPFTTYTFRIYTTLLPTPSGYIHFTTYTFRLYTPLLLTPSGYIHLYYLHLQVIYTFTTYTFRLYTPLPSILEYIFHDKNVKKYNFVLFCKIHSIEVINRIWMKECYKQLGDSSALMKENFLLMLYYRSVAMRV